MSSAKKTVPTMSHRNIGPNRNWDDLCRCCFFIVPTSLCSAKAQNPKRIRLATGDLGSPKGFMADRVSQRMVAGPRPHFAALRHGY